MESVCGSNVTVGSNPTLSASLTVDIVWCFGDDYCDGWQKIDAWKMEFHPRCEKLNHGKWSRLKWRETIESYFWDQSPQASRLTASGRKRTLKVRGVNATPDDFSRARY